MASRSPSPLGMASVALYVVVVAVVEATGWPTWSSLASSPDAIAHGRGWLLLTSGLVVDGIPSVQLVVLAAVLGVALARLGTVRLWIVALSAHVGAALIAYLGVLVLWLVDPGSVDPREPDYGVSVVLAGELGALAVTGGRRMALTVGALALVGFGIGLGESSVLANVEHVLGFAIGAGAIWVLDRPARPMRPAPPAGSAYPAGHAGGDDP